MKNAQALVLESSAPINDGGRKFNVIYYVLGFGFLLTVILMGANILGYILGTLFGLGVAWLIKNKILELESLKLRNIEFVLPNEMAYDDLITNLIPVLVPLGMMIEKSSTNNGNPIINYQGIEYDVLFSNDNKTFTIYWSKNIARAFLTIDSIKMYRKIVVSMGIIAYQIQQLSNK